MRYRPRAAPTRFSQRRKLGDDIYVTGTLGDAALSLLKSGLRLKPRLVAELLARHHRPTARLAIGRLLAQEGLATAMIDISDGLVQDLGHICRASRIGAVLMADSLPQSRANRVLASGAEGLRCALTGGEDYELLFCARQTARDRINKLQQRAKVAITRIGTCVAAKAGCARRFRQTARPARPRPRSFQNDAPTPITVAPTSIAPLALWTPNACKNC